MIFSVFSAILSLNKNRQERVGLEKHKLIGNMMLLLTSIIWGSAFVAQRVGMDYVGPFTFGVSRFVLAALVLIPVIYATEQGEKRKQIQSGIAPRPSEQERKSQRKILLLAGAICGTVLFCGSTMQQFGLVFTTAGKAGFITALYIVFVPIFSLVIHVKAGMKCWIGVGIGAVGLYFLCIKESFTIAPGDLIVLIGAGFWALHLLVIDHFLPKIVSVVKLSFIQFSVCAGYSLICAFIFEDITWQGISQCAIPILYAGVLSGGVGFTLQIFGQRYTSPTVASLILSLEAVFSAVFGFILLHEVMTMREIFGCILMFVAIIISQLPEKKTLEEEKIVLNHEKQEV